MSGGIGILLLLIILVVAVVVGAISYVTGGFLWFGKTSKQGDRTEPGSDAGQRPEHKRPSSPTIEHTDVVGAQEARERNG